MKRLLDLAMAAGLLVLVGPALVLALLLVWAQDGRMPLYLAPRVGRLGHDFRMVKIRTMVIDAESIGGSSTARSDPRITPLGAWLRRWKIDELPQLWNVLTGEMSMVGPRPNVRAGGCELYTDAERRLLDIRPGITDLASIVFADEADILDRAGDADALYDALIRPWKSRLGLLYIDRRSLLADLLIIALTALGLVSRPLALAGVGALLDVWGADGELRRIAGRRSPLPRVEPPALPS